VTAPPIDRAEPIGPSRSVDADAAVDRVHERLLAGRRASDGDGPAAFARREDDLTAWVDELVRDEAPLAEQGDVAEIRARVLARVLGLGPLDPLLHDPRVTDVMVSRGEVWIDRAGQLVRTSIELDDLTVLHLIERILAPLGRHADRANPIVDARLADGSRVHAVVPPLAVDGPCLTIRRFGARTVALDEVTTPGGAELLRWAVRARANIVVSGGAGAGKTTLLNALGAAIPPGERVVTVEDTAELRLPGPHVVRLEARPASPEGTGEVRIRDLVRAALRMRPDRIVVGEVRSGEALDMLQAMNTGHDGSLSTCHANSPPDALRRLETMVLMGDVGLPHAAVREQIASAVDLVVHVERVRGGRRRISAIDEVGPLTDDGRSTTRRLVTALAVEALPSRARRSDEVEPPRPDWLER
jgi:pilus assembly protein CpaF